MRPSILFVDDNEDCRIITFELLRSQGYDPITAASCEEGLERARGSRYDLYLLDYLFADGTGRELCEQIREFDPDTPILFFSASHPSLQQEALSREAQGFVLKPDFTGLREEIGRTLGPPA